MKLRTGKQRDQTKRAKGEEKSRDRTKPSKGKGEPRTKPGATAGKRWRRVGLIGVPALAVIAGVLVWLVFFSSVLVLKTVMVTGTAILAEDEVLHRAEAPIGVPLARVDERAVGERVAQLAAVDQVTVRRHWPDKLEIRVAERTPVFGVGNGERPMLVDAAGAVFPGPKPEGLLLADGPLDNPRLLADTATVVNALPLDLRVRAQRVSFSSTDAITVQLDDDIEVFFGSAEQAELKAQVALALTRGTAAKHIDVSAPTHPSTREGRRERP